MFSLNIAFRLRISFWLNKVLLKLTILLNLQFLFSLFFLLKKITPFLETADSFFFCKSIFSSTQFNFVIRFIPQKRNKDVYVPNSILHQGVI